MLAVLWVLALSSTAAAQTLAPRTVGDVLEQNRFEVAFFRQAVRDVSLFDYWESFRGTAFVPTDEAFKAFMKRAKTTEAALLSDELTLTELVLYHTLPYVVTPSNLWQYNNNSIISPPLHTSLPGEESTIYIVSMGTGNSTKIIAVAGQDDSSAGVLDTQILGTSKDPLSQAAVYIIDNVLTWHGSNFAQLPTTPSPPPPKQRPPPPLPPPRSPSPSPKRQPPPPPAPSPRSPSPQPQQPTPPPPAADTTSNTAAGSPSPPRQPQPTSPSPAATANTTAPNKTTTATADLLTAQAPPTNTTNTSTSSSSSTAGHSISANTIALALAGIILALAVAAAIISVRSRSSSDSPHHRSTTSKPPHPSGVHHASAAAHGSAGSAGGWASGSSYGAGASPPALPLPAVAEERSMVLLEDPVYSIPLGEEEEELQQVLLQQQAQQQVDKSRSPSPSSTSTSSSYIDVRPPSGEEGRRQ